jgi:hypothetical protein
LSVLDNNTTRQIAIAPMIAQKNDLVMIDQSGDGWALTLAWTAMALPVAGVTSITMALPCVSVHPVSVTAVSCWTLAGTWSWVGLTVHPDGWFLMRRPIVIDASVRFVVVKIPVPSPEWATVSVIEGSE